ncbi:zinc knuckle CX2CX4HX4C containing protein, partial [Tanacetum coccineum]
SLDGLNAMLENGPWFIRKNPLILKKWHPDVNLMKEDVGTIPVWVKLHGVPVMAFSEDGLSVFGHVLEECPKNIGVGATKNLKINSQTLKGISVGQKMGFKPTKQQVYQPVFKNPTVNNGGNKKKNVDPTNEVSKSNSFDALNTVDNDVELGTNKGSSHLASQEANYSGSSFWNAESSSPSTTPIIEKINKMENLIIDGKAILVDSE